MNEVTITRQQLRRAIAIELGMPFFRRYPAGQSAMVTGSTVNAIKDTTLTQKDGFWNGSWFYGLVAGDMSVIRDFNAQNRTFQLEVPMAGAPTAGDKYEVHTLWNAVEIHSAINRALQAYSRVFLKGNVDTSNVFCIDNMNIDLTAMTPRPFKINKIYAEKPGTIIRGQATGGAAGTILVATAGIVASVQPGWMVSIYGGTGANQNRTISSVAGTTVNISPNWTTAPDATSLFAIWNPNQQRFDWERLDIFYTDQLEFPATIRMRSRLPHYYGLRMRLEYMTQDTDLLTDTDKTVVLKEVILPKACAILHGQKLNDTKSDRDLHFAENQRYEKMAAEALSSNLPHHPSSTIPVSEGSTAWDLEDPLDWYGGGNRYY